MTVITKRKQVSQREGGLEGVTTGSCSATPLLCVLGQAPWPL